MFGCISVHIRLGTSWSSRNASRRKFQSSSLVSTIRTAVVLVILNLHMVHYVSDIDEGSTRLYGGELKGFPRRPPAICIYVRACAIAGVVSAFDSEPEGESNPFRIYVIEFERRSLCRSCMLRN
jgi:hypothetical protein